MVKPIITGFLLLGLLAFFIYLLWSRYAPGRNIYAVDQPGNADACIAEIRFAIIGDYGDAGQPEKAIAAMIKNWQPQFIVTVGDNNYPNGAARTIDDNTGRYFSDYIAPYKGVYGRGADENRFFPALGNHDWRSTGAQPYLDYFSLPGNERYYDVRKGPVHLFILDSEEEEPHGRSEDSVQAAWLRDQMAASDATWKIVALHHPPYSSGRKHGSQEIMQWDFAGMGAAAVLAGHEHLYERLQREGIPYFVNGLGGRRCIYPFADPIEGSAVRYNQDFGAMLVTAGETCLNFSFYNQNQERIDSITILAE